MKKKEIWINLVLGVVLIGLMMISSCMGKYHITPSQCIRFIGDAIGSCVHHNPAAEGMSYNMLIYIRLPRIVGAVLVGMALSVSGTVYQGVFKNPLVSPDFLGVSAGACIGAACGILWSMSAGMLQLLAFSGGIIAVSLALLLPKLLRSDAHVMLVLSGIVVGGFLSSILGFIKYIADPDTQLAAITYWQMGSLSYIEWKHILEILPIFLIAMLLLELLAWRIDILSLGDEDAKVLGMHVSRWRSGFVILATLLTAGAVCIAGTIGWIGLVIPHAGRALVGTSHRKLIPVTAMLGGSFLLIIDTITRTIGPSEMPISILTGVLGAPFYAWILYKHRRKLG